MKFIKLTLTRGDYVFVNFNLVRDFSRFENETVIMYNLIDEYIRVKETPEEILKLLNDITAN